MTGRWRVGTSGVGRHRSPLARPSRRRDRGDAVERARVLALGEPCDGIGLTCSPSAGCCSSRAGADRRALLGVRSGSAPRRRRIDHARCPSALAAIKRLLSPGSATCGCRKRSGQPRLSPVARDRRRERRGALRGVELGAHRDARRRVSRPAAGPRRLPSRRSAVPTVRRLCPVPQDGSRQPDRVLVRGLPAVSRSVTGDPGRSA